LRLNFPIGLVQNYSLPTTGYQNIIMKYETRRSGSGANRQMISYSSNGADYISFETITITEVPSVYTLDFSAIPEVNNNANFVVRTESAQEDDGTGGNVGNQRLDNVTIEGLPFQEPDVLLHYWNFNNTSDFLTANYT